MIPPELLVDMGTYGALLVVIVWLLKANHDLQTRLGAVEDKLFELLDKTNDVVAQLEDLPRK